MKKFFVITLTMGISLALAAKAPTHHSLRAEAMGNAHVAVVDDKEAIYFNYAGLSQINRLGNYKYRPEQGYYPRNMGDMRINFGGGGPFEDYFSTFNDVMDIQDLAQRANDAGGDYNGLLDSLSNHPELTSMMNSYDHKRLDMRIKFDAEMAFHGFGGAIWVDGSIAPYLDGGLIIPFMVIDTFYIDAVAQLGTAYSLTDKLSLGVGGKVAKRQKVAAVTLDVKNYKTLQDTLSDRIDDIIDDLDDASAISFGLDFGSLYQLTREVRLGASLRDIYFTKLAGDRIIPNLTMGVNYSPVFFNKNTGFGRKLNLALDYADAFESEHNYKPLSHINFGFEFEQSLLAIPGYYTYLRALALRLSGGFKGGYPTAGVAVEVLRFITLELATWGEEQGYYTGQDEERVYMAQLSIGF
ncbi:MAG: hypothetical protein HUK20_00835 [Fibrobacter sp.]|nr:hypothetical protein [Fibrobacter sp.]